MALVFGNEPAQGLDRAQGETFSLKTAIPELTQVIAQKPSGAVQVTAVVALEQWAAQEPMATAGLANAPNDKDEGVRVRAAHESAGAESRRRRGG
jgi:hypothetical protein